jgi:hypothetical protein
MRTRQAHRDNQLHRVHQGSARLRGEKATPTPDAGETVTANAEASPATPVLQGSYEDTARAVDNVLDVFPSAKVVGQEVRRA